MIKVQKNTDKNYKITDNKQSTIGHYFVGENNEVMTYISASYGALTILQLTELLYEAQKVEYEINTEENKKD